MEDIRTVLITSNRRRVCEEYFIHFCGINAEILPKVNWIKICLITNQLVIQSERKLVELMSNINYSHEVEMSDNEWLTFVNIPKEWDKDITFMLDGKYSFVSKKAKNIIRDNTDKPYSKKLGYDISIIALNPNSMIGMDFRRKLSEYLDVVLDKNSQLMSKPNLDVELWINE